MLLVIGALGLALTLIDLIELHNQAWREAAKYTERGRA
jgi:hypothetical protein